MATSGVDEKTSVFAFVAASGGDVGAARVVSAFVAASYDAVVAVDAGVLALLLDAAAVDVDVGDFHMDRFCGYRCHYRCLCCCCDSLRSVHKHCE